MRKIGLLKELKPTEGRVMLTPEGVKVLIKNGAEVFVEQGAGEVSRFEDIQYERAGATILPTMEKIMQRAQILLQVSPPQPIEFELLNETHQFISFYNLLNLKEDRFRALVESGATFFSGELIQNEQGKYPLLMGMSEISGRLAIHLSAQLLSTVAGGKGKLLSGMELIKPAQITIIGGGKVGRTAARSALINGAQVTILNIKNNKLKALQAEFPEARIEDFSEERLRDVLPETDVLIVSVYSLKQECEIKITREMIGLMEEGSVVVDVSINQSAVVETSHSTTLDQPTFVVDGIVHYCVPNLSAAVPLTASRVITKKILPFIKTLMQNELKESLVYEPGLLSALTIYKNKVTHRSFADRFGYEFYNIFELLELNL